MSVSLVKAIPSSLVTTSGPTQPTQATVASHHMHVPAGNGNATKTLTGVKATTQPSVTLVCADGELPNVSLEVFKNVPFISGLLSWHAVAAARTEKEIVQSEKDSKDDNASQVMKVDLKSFALSVVKRYVEIKMNPTKQNLSQSPDADKLQTLIQFLGENG